MAVKLTQFLAKLASEPREFARFFRSPATYMTKAGLSRAQQKLIQSGNRKKIEAALRKEQKGKFQLLPIGRFQVVPLLIVDVFVS